MSTPCDVATHSEDGRLERNVEADGEREREGVG